MPHPSTPGLAVELAEPFTAAPPVRWSAGVLRAVAAERLGAGAAWTVQVTGAGAPTGSEAFALRPGGHRIRVAGSDARGAAYGLLDLADRLRLATDPERELEAVTPTVQRPATPLRGVLRAFCSDVLDAAWLRDRDFWRGYLDELATDRVNRLHLAFGMQYNYSHDHDVRDNYLCFAYPFLLDVPGWDVRVEGLTAAERDANLAALRFASDEAARRGIDFQLGLWNHAVRPETTDSPHLRYPVLGLTEQDTAAYSARALRLLLEHCPGITGVTFRVHYEGGVHEHGRAAFWRTVFEAVRQVDRPIGIDMHSKGVDAEMLRTARQATDRATISAKYWAEHQGLPYHQAAVRDLERARPADTAELSGVTQNTRRFTRYGYGDFLRADRDHGVLFRLWPGSQRFLLSGDPALFAGYGRCATIGGALGVELCEPLTFRGRKDSGRGGHRDLYADGELAQPATADWTKYRYTYRLWGRLLYDPDSPADTWRPLLRRDYGAAATAVEDGLAAASRVLPLITVAQGISASNNYYWPELIWNLPIGAPGHSDEYDFDTPAPGSWGAISPFDPALFTTTDQAAEEHTTGTPSGRYTPLHVAAWLDRLADRATAAVAAVPAVGSAVGPTVRRAVVDITVQAHLATFFAAKLRAGLAHALFQRSGEVGDLAEAVGRYRRGRDAYRRIVTATDGVYVADLGFGDRLTEHGHWRDRLAQIDADVTDLEQRLGELDPAGTAAPTRLPTPGADVPVDHRPPVGATRGEPLDLTVTGAAERVRLHYRHLNQGEDWQHADLRATGGTHTGSVPGDYTDSPYPIAYYFTAWQAGGAVASLAPGLGPDLAGRPYHIVTPCPPASH
jgi:hypothetical protein